METDRLLGRGELHSDRFGVIMVPLRIAGDMNTADQFLEETHSTKISLTLAQA